MMGAEAAAAVLPSSLGRSPGPVDVRTAARVNERARRGCKHVRTAGIVGSHTVIARRTKDANPKQSGGGEEIVQERKRDRRPEKLRPAKADRENLRPMHLVEERGADRVEEAAFGVRRRVQHKRRT